MSWRCASSWPKITCNPRTGKIVVLDGRLLYIINEPREEICLEAGTFGVVEPGALHWVKLLGKVRFYIEFYR